MKMIFKYLYFIKKILITQKINGLLYYAKMIPVLGKYIPDRFYRLRLFKEVAGILWLIASFLFTCLTKIIYIMVMIVLPVSVLSKGEMDHFAILWVFFWLSGLAGPLLMNVTTQPQKKEYVMISLMHMNARRYVLAQWLWTIVIEGGLLLLVLIALWQIKHGPLWYGISMFLCYLSSHIIGEAIHIHYFQHHEKPLATRFAFVIPCFLLFYAAAYGWIYLIPTASFSADILAMLMLVMSIGGLFAIPYLCKVDYTQIMKKGILMNQSIYDGTMLAKNKKADIELKDKDYDDNELKEQHYQQLHGYQYLNALFFQRHKRLFYRPMRRRIIGIIGAFVLLDGLIIFAQLELPLNQPLTLIPAILFLLYFISIGERVTRAMFYNCDASLLHYGYYRQPDAILTNFKIRLKKIIGMNCMLALLMCIGYCVTLCLVWQSDYVLFDHILLIMTVFSISIFFSIHHLFLYYVLQPYTGSLEMRSPMFGVINTIVYLVCYFSTRLEGTILLTIVILILTFVYSIIAMLLVYRLAPKNFHIR